MNEPAEGESRAEAVRERVTVPVLQQRKNEGRPIVMLTAYDYPSARLAERAGVDIVLVGDTVGIMMLGYDTTVPVTMEDMLHHVRAVRRGLKRSFLLADLPFGSYEASPTDAVHNAARLMKEAGAQAVKMEGGAAFAPTVRKMTDAGIPVMAHIGLMPQSVHLLGGHKAQGRDEEAAEQIRQDARAMEAAGAFGILLEAIPTVLAEQITNEVAIPTIGIGAGPRTSGQVQVWHDILGIPPGKNYRHVKRFAQIGDLIETALRDYVEEVRQSAFPTKENSL